MCNPLTIGSAVVMAAGTGMQMRAQKKAQKAINNAIRENGESNDRLRKDSQDRILNKSDDFSRESFDRNQDQETAKVKAQFDQQISQGALPGEYYGGMQSENTQKYMKDQNEKAQGFSQQISDALARLRGFDQGQAVNTRGVQRVGERVGINQNKEAGNNAILPIQIEAAKSKGYSPLGNIFVGLGSAGLTAGLGSMAGAGAGAAGGAGNVARVAPINPAAGPGFILP